MNGYAVNYRFIFSALGYLKCLLVYDKTSNLSPGRRENYYCSCARVVLVSVIAELDFLGVCTGC